MRIREREGGWVVAERRRFLEILAVTSFVVAQPILDVFGKSPETFVFRDVGALGIVVFALVVTVVPAVGVWAAGSAAAAVGPRARGVAHAGTIGVLVTVLSIQVLKKLTPLPGPALGLAGAAVGIVGTVAVVRTAAFRRWIRLAWPASIAFLLIFLLLSPVTKLILPAAEGRAAVGRAAPVPVVMVVWDQFPLLTILERDGSINERLFPNFAALGEEATWFRNFTVTETHTYFSVPTLLTGRLSRDRSKDALAVDYPDNLFSLLEASHRMFVYERVTEMCPEDLCSGDPEGSGGPSRSGDEQGEGLLTLWGEAGEVWADISLPTRVRRDITAQFEEPAEDELSPGGEQGEEGAAGSGRVGRLESFMRSFGSAEQPALHYYHPLLPHLPWRRFPSGSTYMTVGGARDDQPLIRDRDPWRWVEDRWAVQLARQRHILQAQYVDGLLGEMIGAMKREGIYDEALLIITSDHGISLHPGRSRGGTVDNMHEIFWVPMFIKEPGQREGRVDRANRTAPDLLPSIADVLEIGIPWETDGVSMLEEDPPRGSLKAVQLYDDDGERGPTLRMSMEEAARRMRREAFAPATDPDEPAMLPYLIGPGAELIGQGVRDLPVGPPSGRSVSLDVPSSFRVEEGAALPAFFWGVVSDAPEGSDVLIALAVNGRIAGVSGVWTQDGIPGRFGMLAPEGFLKEGHNTVRLFELEGDVLRRLRPG